jgi:hypothetical protein
VRESAIIIHSGLRSGEKLYGELLADTDQMLPSGRSRLSIAKLQAQADGACADELLRWLPGGSWGAARCGRASSPPYIECNYRLN